MMLGSAYLGGAYFFLRAGASTSWPAVKAGFPPVIVFASLMGVATVAHWGQVRPSVTSRSGSGSILYFAHSVPHHGVVAVEPATRLRARPRRPTAPAQRFLERRHRSGSWPSSRAILLFLFPVHGYRISGRGSSLLPSARVVGAVFSLGCALIGASIERLWACVLLPPLPGGRASCWSSWSSRLSVLTMSSIPATRRRGCSPSGSWSSPWRLASCTGRMERLVGAQESSAQVLRRSRGLLQRMQVDLVRRQRPAEDARRFFDATAICGRPEAHRSGDRSPRLRGSMNAMGRVVGPRVRGRLSLRARRRPSTHSLCQVPGRVAFEVAKKKSRHPARRLQRRRRSAPLRAHQLRAASDHSSDVISLADFDDADLLQADVRPTHRHVDAVLQVRVGAEEDRVRHGLAR